MRLGAASSLCAFSVGVLPILGSTMKCLTLLTHNLTLRTAEDQDPLVAVSGTSLLLMTSVEEDDADADVIAVVKRVMKILHSAQSRPLKDHLRWPPDSIVVMPFGHLSDFASTNRLHTQRILFQLSSSLRDSIPTYLVPPSSSDTLLSDLALFDSSITTRLSSSPNSMRHVMKAWRRVFATSTIEKALHDVAEGQ
jgi:hypothetical protein